MAGVVHFSMTNYEVTQFLYKCHRKNDERPFMTDLDVVCKGGYIPVHSPILMAASPILKEHIMGQPRDEHMVIHLLDYDIVDVTPVMQCFYTGRCLITRKNMATVYEIFESLGVSNANTAIIAGAAKEEDLSQKCCIRRYLDCDDDDEFIDDEEILNEVENHLDREDDRVQLPHDTPPPDTSSQSSFRAKVQPQPRGTHFVKVGVRNDVNQNDLVDEPQINQHESSPPVASDQDDDDDEDVIADDEIEIENRVAEDESQEKDNDEVDKEDEQMEQEEIENEPPEEDEEENRVAEPKNLRKRNGSHASRKTKRTKKSESAAAAHPPSEHSDDRDSLYVPGTEDREPSPDEAEDSGDSEDLDLENDDDVAGNFIVSDSASLEYSPGGIATRSGASENSNRKKKNDKRTLRTHNRDMRHRLRTRRHSSKSKSPRPPKRRLRQRHRSGNVESKTGSRVDRSHDESDESDEHLSVPKDSKSKKLRGRKTAITCPVCLTEYFELYFEAHIQTVCGKTLSQKCGVKERECYGCKKKYASMRLERFIRHVQECYKPKASSSSENEEQLNNNNDDESDHDDDDGNEQQQQKQKSAAVAEDSSSATSDDDDEGIEGEERVTVQNSKARLYVKLTRLSDAKFDYHYQKLRQLKRQAENKDKESSTAKSADANSDQNISVNEVNPPPSPPASPTTTTTRLLQDLGDGESENNVREVLPPPNPSNTGLSHPPDNAADVPMPPADTIAETTSNDERANDEDDENENVSLVRIKDFSEILEPDESMEDRNQNTNVQLSSIITTTTPSTPSNYSSNSVGTVLKSTAVSSSMSGRNVAGPSVVNPHFSNVYQNIRPSHSSPTTAIVHPTVSSAASPDQSRNAESIANGIIQVLQENRNRVSPVPPPQQQQITYNSLNSNNTRTLLVSPVRPSTPNTGQQIVLTSGSASITRQPSPRPMSSTLSSTTFPRQQAQLPVTNPESAVARRSTSFVQAPQQPYMGGNSLVNTSSIMSTVFCGVTTINGVPFKVYQRPEAIEPTPQALFTVGGSIPNGLRRPAIPQNAQRLSITYPSPPPQQLQVATSPQVSPAVQSLPNIVLSADEQNPQQQQDIVARRNSNGVIRCEKCSLLFSNDSTFRHHICLEVD